MLGNTYNQLDGAAAKHGFETALIMCGRTVNEDASLGFAHTTAGAKDFFEVRCHANTNTIIGHLKTHVYNQVSLDLVNDAFNGTADGSNNERSLPTQDTLGVRVEPPRVPGPPVLDSLRDTLTGQGMSETQPSGSTDHPAPAPNDDLVASIKAAIVASIRSAGGDVSRLKPGSFPWTALAGILAEQGLVMRGWPADVLMPGEVRKKNNNTRTKGITVLRKMEQRMLYSAFENDEITMSRVEGREQRRALVNAEVPVIISAPPPADSRMLQGSRMYSDCSIDLEGPERLPLGNPTTRIRQRPAPHARAIAEDPIILSSGDSEDSTKIRVLTKKAVGTNVAKKKARWVDVDSSDKETRTAHWHLTAQTEKRRSTTLTGEEEGYQSPGPSKKRKANASKESRPLKKRAVSGDRTVKIGKGKGKDVDQKGNGDRQGNRFAKGSLFLDSDSDFSKSGDELPIPTVKAPNEAHEEGLPATSDPFIGPSDPAGGVVFGAPPASIAPIARPSSPSPRRPEPHRPLDEFAATAGPSSAGDTARILSSSITPALSEQLRQQVGGGYGYAGDEAPYLVPVGMVPQNRYQDASGRFYPEEIYREDPRGVYSSLYPDGRRSIPRYPVAYVDPRQLQVGPAHPRASRSPSLTDLQPLGS